MRRERQVDGHVAQDDVDEVREELGEHCLRGCEQHERGHVRQELIVAERLAQGVAEARPRGSLPRGRPAPERGDGRQPRRQRQQRHHGAHGPEPRARDQHTAREEHEPRARCAKVHLQRRKGHSLLRRARHLGKQRFVRSADNGVGQEEGFEDHEEPEGVPQALIAGRRDPQEREGQRQDRRAIQDERKPAAPAGAEGVAPVPDERVVEGLDDPAREENDADGADGHEGLAVGIGRRVEEQEPGGERLEGDVGAEAT